MIRDEIYKECKKMPPDSSKGIRFSQHVVPTHEELVQFAKRLEKLANSRSHNKKNGPTTFLVIYAGGFLTIYYYEIKFGPPTI